jgi:AraC family transcriptional regulator
MGLHLLTLDTTSVLDLRDESDYVARFGNNDVLLLGRAQQTLAWTSWTPASIWMVLRGGMRFQSREFRLDLASGELLISEQGARVTAQALLGDSTFWAVGLLLGPTTLRRLAADLGEQDLLPARYREASAINVALTRLAHGAVFRANGPMPAASELDSILEGLCLRQREFQAHVERCPGRSLRHRRQVFLRLQRARNYIESNHATPMDLGDLAAIANLSRSHFLRLFHKVFGMTPHQHLTRMRLDAARELVVGSVFSIADIATRLGFLDRCSFARLFKQHFGVSASCMRSLNSASSVSSAVRRISLATHVDSALAI